MKKKSKKYNIGYYSYNAIDTHNTSYKIVVGQRSNGKTFGALEKIFKRIRYQLDSFGCIKTKFLYVRRTHNLIVKNKALKIFNDVNDKLHDKYGFIIEYNAYYDYYFIKNDNKEYIVGYKTCVEDAFEEKGVPLEDVDFMYFDEFMDYAYFDDEIGMFLHLMSTLTRDGTRKVDVYMTANSTMRQCPYFDLFKIDIKKLKKGTIAEVRHKNGVSVAIEYCAMTVKSEEEKKFKRHPYLGFDDSPEVNMILYGDFEVKQNNIENVDGISWTSKREIIPAYISCIGECYEMSLYTGNKTSPILFVRKPNIQNGLVNKNILYNICTDSSTILSNKYGNVQYFSKISDKFMDEKTIKMLNIAKECLRCKRVVYSDLLTATEFEANFEKV